MYSAQFKNGMDVLPWMEAQETAALKVFDANDWIYQTWAYDRHDVGRGASTFEASGDHTRHLRQRS